MYTRIGKVQVTSDISHWWESELKNIFIDPKEVKILSAVEYDGKLYLIYLYDTEDEQS